MDQFKIVGILFLVVALCVVGFVAYTKMAPVDKPVQAAVVQPQLVVPSTGMRIISMDEKRITAEVMIRKDFLSAEEWAKITPKAKHAVVVKEEDLIEVDDETGLPLDDE